MRNGRIFISACLICFLAILFCNISFGETGQVDSLRLKDFNNCKDDEAKLTWLSNKDFQEVSDFIKRNPQAYSDCVKRISNGNNDYLKYQLNLFEGLLNYNQSHFQKAFPLYLNILGQRQFVNQADSIKALINLKYCFAQLLNFPKVFEMHQILLGIAKRNPKINHNSLGQPLSQIYLSMGLLDEGLKYLKREYEAEKGLGERDIEANYLNNLGIVFQKNNSVLRN